MQSSKTGLIYDARMTQHKSKRKHPQRPQRVKFIMKLLQQKFYTTHPHVQYINSIQRVINNQVIRLVHPEAYIKHVSTLWPKTSHRRDITVLDTYFNEKSQMCAKLAIGGVLDGIDRIMNGKWENGFACVRPPGHHSGGRHTINGFCIYNNVAIGARYLLEHHKINRVAIVDWDVHHGDGTQHAFQKQKNIMLISIHRYDRGTFYPSEPFADVTSQGLGDAEGTKINLPLDYVDQGFKQYKFQSPGDNEYIYLYHRIIEPVLKQFKPDFILVSCGFDAARGDPLGGFTVTPNGYYYLTKRLTELQKPMLVVLQGGYNLQSISNSAEAVMRALVHDQRFPQPLQISQHQIKNKCQIPNQIHKQIDRMVQVLSKKWPNLKQNEDLKGYTDLIKQNQQRFFGTVNDQESSSSSQEQQETSSISQKSDISTQSAGHRYNTRSKTKATQAQLQKIAELKELQSQNKQWQKQKNKMKKKEQKVLQQTSKSDKSEAKKQKQPLKQVPNVNKKQSKQKIKKQPKDEQEEKYDDDSVITQFYFAAGHLQKFKNFSPQNEKITKITYPQQVNFYQNMTFEKQFTPKYYGKESQDCIIIQNLLFQQEDPVVIDVKVSKQSENPVLTEDRKEKERKKQQKSMTQQYGFRISGYTTPIYKQGGLLEKSQQSVRKILKNVVTLENKQFFCDYLKKLSEALNTSTRRYYGTSILLIKGPKRSQIRWVDFHYWHDSNGPDKQMIKGVNNLRTFIEQLQLSN